MATLPSDEWRLGTRLISTVGRAETASKDLTSYA